MGDRRSFPLLLSLLLLIGGLGVFVVNATSTGDGDSGTEDGIHFFAYDNQLAAGGYDVVAYFKVSQAVVGSEDYEVNFAGLPWRFSSAENRDEFTHDPAHYLPQYGGHCAYGVAQNYLVRGDPTAWSIHDGRLYFNYSKGVRHAWLAGVDSYLDSGEKNWPALNQASHQP